jgi:hypothetical protein
MGIPFPRVVTSTNLGQRGAGSSHTMAPANVKSPTRSPPQHIVGQGCGGEFGRIDGALLGGLSLSSTPASFLVTPALAQLDRGAWGKDPSTGWELFYQEVVRGRRNCHEELRSVTFYLFSTLTQLSSIFIAFLLRCKYR